MTDLSDLYQRAVALTGRFPDFSKADIEALLRGRGAWQVQSGPNKESFALVADTPDGKKQDKARELGVPIVLAEELRAALGEPLAGYRARLERQIDAQPNYINRAWYHLGAPASAESIQKVEARLGRPLPLSAKNLFAQLNGITLVWVSPKMQDTVSEPLSWGESMDPGGGLYATLSAHRDKNKSRFWGGVINIPDVETLFLTEWEDRVFYRSAKGPKATVKVGKKKVGADAFYDNLFLLDAFHPYYQAGLWADPDSGEFFVVYGSDHGADWLWSTPISFEVYMEYLAWELGSNRMIDPASKLGMTKAMLKAHPRSWFQLDITRTFLS
ncbi:MAG: hypothetical protein H6741_19200 [Alphaproteobacteria bacterium]|nr:hypothetical protein [Alphaproteobacteria bacterium]